jgi:Helix-turn-helix domain
MSIREVIMTSRNASAQPSSAIVVGQPINPYGLFTGSWVPEWLERRNNVTSAAKLVYARLGRYMGANNITAWPTQKTLGMAVGLSERTVRDALNELCDAGLLQRDRRGLGKSNLYEFLGHRWMIESLKPEGFRSAREEAADPERQELPISNGNSRLSHRKTVREDSQKKTFRRTDGAPHEQESPALGASPDEQESSVDETPRSKSAPRPDTAYALAKTWVHAMDQGRVDRGAIVGERAVSGHLAQLMRAGVSADDIRAMIERYAKRPDDYRANGVKAFRGFIAASERLLADIAKTKPKTYKTGVTGKKDAWS